MFPFPLGLDSKPNPGLSGGGLDRLRANLQESGNEQPLPLSESKTPVQGKGNPARVVIKGNTEIMYCPQSCKQLVQKVLNPDNKRKRRIRYACESSKGCFARLSADANGVPIAREDCPKNAPQCPRRECVTNGE